MLPSRESTSLDKNEMRYFNTNGEGMLDDRGDEQLAWHRGHACRLAMR